MRRNRYHRSALDNGLISLLARADSPKVCVVRREAPLRSLSGLALSRAIAPHPYSRGRALAGVKQQAIGIEMTIQLAPHCGIDCHQAISLARGGPGDFQRAT